MIDLDELRNRHEEYLVVTVEADQDHRGYEGFVLLTRAELNELLDRVQQGEP